jgi:hypothetical protein
VPRHRIGPLQAIGTLIVPPSHSSNRLESPPHVYMYISLLCTGQSTFGNLVPSFIEHALVKLFGHLFWLANKR